MVNNTATANKGHKFLNDGKKNKGQMIGHISEKDINVMLYSGLAN